MTDQKINLPFESPVVPAILNPESKIRFNCYKGISCFNACCRQADITLTPYDVLVLKDHLQMTSGEFLKKHSVPFEMDADGLPGIKLRTKDEAPVCLFMTDEGCSVYASRPSSCRYYPAGLLAQYTAGSGTDQMNHCLVKEDHCMGHNEDREQTLSEYRKEQGLDVYDEMNREWYQIILKKRSTGPTAGKPPEMTFQLFFLASYDIDRFRTFICTPGFRKNYLLEDDTWKTLEQDDRELLKFGYRLMKQVFFNEQTIPVVEGAVEKRIEERGDVIQQRRELELAMWRDQQEQAKRDASEQDVE